MPERLFITYLRKLLPAVLFLIFSGSAVWAQNAGNYLAFPENVLNDPVKNGKLLETAFTKTEIPHAKIDTSYDQVFLKNGYSKYRILNPESWLKIKSNNVPTEIQIIFSKYPKDKEFWVTNYNVLLANRLKALFKVDPTLNDKRIDWKIVMQTDCETEAQAQALPHGILIKVMPEKEDPLAGIQKDSSYFAKQTRKIMQFLKQQTGSNLDSTVYKIFDRHPEWKNSLVVMDWTGSMYKYGATAVLWHTLHQKQSGIKSFVFFNDGDDSKNEEKRIGSTGGIYGSETENISRVINLFYTVMARGNGGDTPENNLEAIMYGVNKFPNFEQLILIADNNACIKDYKLIDSIRIPVKVILCGTEKGINPQYINLAYKTKGSIHTIEQDIYDMISKSPDKTFSLNGIEFKLNEYDHFEPVKPQMMNDYYCDEFYSDEYIDFKLKMKQDSLYFKKLKTKAENFIYFHGGIGDSLVYKTFEMHPEWSNAMVCMDFTKGMYHYSAQAILWHVMHLNRSSIRYFSFTNDGDAKKENKKRLGSTGGIYTEESKKISKVVNMIYRIVAKGTGGENPDNIVEMMNKSAKKSAGFSDMILVADNNACIRDFRLADTTRKNIHIILCNTSKGVNPMYINLAAKLKGTLYLSPQQPPIQIRGQKEITVGKYTYRKNNFGIYETVKTQKTAELPFNCDKYYSEEYYKFQKKENSFWKRIF